ncbi:ATP-dependent protease ATPase subunit HslU [Cytophaga hutchinsonii]|uniref:ATP-dependent protease ATPase subunit HslU n=1 Tax=Cytophaga hutchinsonii (strain ATCC 33406 / DSM 1761 / CIP 103989 / NBRC 15051 / NCIMB 9469 / D465) TaxID=269798 RepID=HSLU_CYTH3|nr:ATP-dependent protease ATPase subunit HslU [Cytophaga hutchinsonii]Q11QT3.1 RecName: Full=ATP-dependent protease ATPase subunit HslU; AltName: Full=Unfoldase HslU [Cytophaga hutchinsonii ATCC 33406]ABG60231.1 ATP-dependent hsl protease, ATP-binding subunit (heat shock protein) [Cytophaga hutchinsonii ATCC 33406]SFX21263.1 ATP-dependent HslUV protease ATP-binding subunit HslU [Cytophaga hutchinsonii ATCC 33406]
MTALQGFLTPTEIVAELDKYIIGQHDAKRNVAIALRNRWRRMHADADMRKEIMPNNILLIGPTGVGKTEIARRLAKLADAPFTKVEASKFTEVGYVGRDVESMVRDLVEQAVNMVKTQKKEEVKIKVSQVVEDILLDLLIPPVKSTGMGFKTASTQSIDTNEIPDNDQELNERTRELFREKIRSGELDERKVEINVQQQGPGVGVVGGAMDEASMMNIQEMIGNMMPKKTKKRKLSIAEARKILLEEESAKLIDMDDVKDEAIRKTENMGIIFIDEIDKVASSKKGNGPDVSREGVQRDLLPIVEGSAVNTKYGTVHTDHILFIAAGAFHVSKPSDLIPELQGRFPIRVELNSLTEADFYHILKEPKNALTRQYQALLSSENVNIEFHDDALKAISEIAFELNVEVENIGARRLHTVMSHLLNELLFDVPDKIETHSTVVITKELVDQKLKGLVKNRDLSQFIL